jgi:hypothetical protein
MAASLTSVHPEMAFFGPILRSRPFAIETFEKCSILFKFKAGDPPEAD